MLKTRNDFERARAALEERTPQELAAFVMTLAQASNGIGNYVLAFAMSGDPQQAAGLLDREITALRDGQSDYTYRHRKSFELSARAERTLDAIEKFVLPRDRDRAVELLNRFVAWKDQILGNCYEDDDAGRIFERAREILKSVQTGP